MTDPIMAEVWAVRDRLAARFDYDLEAIFKDLRAEEARSGLSYEQYPPRRLRSGENPVGNRVSADPATSEQQRIGPARRRGPAESSPKSQRLIVGEDEPRTGCGKG